MQHEFNIRRFEEVCPLEWSKWMTSSLCTRCLKRLSRSPKSHLPIHLKGVPCGGVQIDHAPAKMRGRAAAEAVFAIAVIVGGLSLFVLVPWSLRHTSASLQLMADRIYEKMDATSRVQTQLMNDVTAAERAVRQLHSNVLLFHREVNATLDANPDGSGMKGPGKKRHPRGSVDLEAVKHRVRVQVDAMLQGLTPQLEALRHEGQDTLTQMRKLARKFRKGVASGEEDGELKGERGPQKQEAEAVPHAEGARIDEVALGDGSDEPSRKSSGRNPPRSDGATAAGDGYPLFVVKWHGETGPRTSKTFRREEDADAFYADLGDFAKKLVARRGRGARWESVKEYGDPKWLVLLSNDDKWQNGVASGGGRPPVMT
jgi:hypothetical protein